MGLFTTRQLLGYTEQKVKFRALFLELFFRRTVNFHTEEVMLDKITGKTPVAAYVSPIVEGKVLRHRGGETRVLRPGYVKPKHEFNYQQAVERLPGEDPAQLNDPAYQTGRIISAHIIEEVMVDKGKEILAVRNAASNEYGGINCEVQFEDAVNEKGEQVWLPYTATETDNTEHGKALWSGLTAGTYGSVSAFVATEAVLEAAKAAKREEINIWRDVQENMEYVMEFNGRNWDYGKKTLSRISTTRLMAENNRLPEGFAWTDGDNNVVPVTAAEIIALADATEQAMFAKGVEINTRQLQMKAEVEALTDLKAIRSYAVGWPAG